MTLQPSPKNLSDELREKIRYIFSDLGKGDMRNGEYIYRDMDTCVNEAIAAITAIYAKAIREYVPEKDELLKNLKEHGLIQ